MDRSGDEGGGEEDVAAALPAHEGSREGEGKEADASSSEGGGVEMGKEEEEEAQEGRKGSRVHSSKKRRGSRFVEKMWRGGERGSRPLSSFFRPRRLSASLCCYPPSSLRSCV